MSRIITNAELANRSLADLQALYRKAHADMVRSAEGSSARRNAVASLENISRAIATARARLSGPRF